MLTIVLLIGIVAVLGSLVLGRDGAASLLALRGERQRLGEQAVALLQQNEELRDRIARLRTDDRFLESLARRELGLVHPDEIVYRFHRPGRAAAPP